MTAGPPLPRDPRGPDRIAVDIAVRLALLAAFAYLALELLRPFLGLFLWSVVLAVILYPAFDWLRRRLGGRGSLAAVLVTAAGLAVVLGPATVLISSLIHTLEALAHHFGPDRPQLPPPPEALRQLPIVGDSLIATWTQATSNLEAFLVRYGRPLLPAGEWLLRVVARLGGSVVVILVAVLVSGFLLVPGPRLVGACRKLSTRLAPGHGREFVDLAGATIRNVARGVLGISTLQALLVGLGLIVAGIPAAGLLSLVALVLAILQVGLVPLAAPLVLWAWFHLDTAPALILSAYLVVVTFLDGPLKALVMGKGLHTPFLVILAGVIGGTIAYGLVGLFLGPILLAVFYDLVVFWAAEPEPGPGGSE